MSTKLKGFSVLALHTKMGYFYRDEVKLIAENEERIRILEQNHSETKVYVKAIKHNGISQEQKEAIRDSALKGINEEMEVKEFQSMGGLSADGGGGIIIY